jgi:hypothetical protein
MKRLLAVFAFLTLGAAAAFGSPSDEVLLAPDGSVFAVSVVSGEQLPEGSSATTALRLRIARGEEVSEQFVPASLTDGRNWNPALAYDRASETLFIFWVRAPQITTSELLICSFKDGEFGTPTVLDGGLFRYRENLQIAITRFALDEMINGLRPVLAIHAIWWDTDGWDQGARYAQLQIAEGRAVVVDLRNAVDLLLSEGNGEPMPAPEGFDERVLTFPTVTSSTMLDRVEVTFGEKETNRIHRADLVPVIAYGVLRPPIGIRRGAVPAPIMAVGADSSIATLVDPLDDESLLLYSVEDSKVRYRVFEGGEWTETNSIALDTHVTEAAAVDALKRRLAER